MSNKIKIAAIISVVSSQSGTLAQTPFKPNMPGKIKTKGKIPITPLSTERRKDFTALAVEEKYEIHTMLMPVIIKAVK